MTRYKGHIIITTVVILLMMAVSSCSVKRQVRALYAGKLDTVAFNMPQRTASPVEIDMKKIAQDTIIVTDLEGNVLSR